MSKLASKLGYTAAAVLACQNMKIGIKNTMAENNHAAFGVGSVQNDNCKICMKNTEIRAGLSDSLL